MAASASYGVSLSIDPSTPPESLQLAPPGFVQLEYPRSAFPPPTHPPAGSQPVCLQTLDETTLKQEGAEKSIDMPLPQLVGFLACPPLSPDAPPGFETQASLPTQSSPVSPHRNAPSVSKLLQESSKAVLMPSPAVKLPEKAPPGFGNLEDSRVHLTAENSGLPESAKAIHGPEPSSPDKAPPGFERPAALRGYKSLDAPPGYEALDAPPGFQYPGPRPSATPPTSLELSSSPSRPPPAVSSPEVVCKRRRTEKSSLESLSTDQQMDAVQMVALPESAEGSPQEVLFPESLSTDPGPPGFETRGSCPSGLPPLPPPVQLPSLPAPASQHSSPEIGQMVCGGCHSLLSYPRGARHVECPSCKTVNFVLEAQQVGLLKCLKCHVLLMYPYGARSVQCSSCLLVTEVNAHNLQKLSVHQPG